MGWGEQVFITVSRCHNVYAWYLTFIPTVCTHVTASHDAFLSIQIHIDVRYEKN